MIHHCSHCQASKEVKSAKSTPPRGWRALHAQLYCDTCWKARYRVIAISLPVAAPMGCEWKDLDETLRNAWGLITRGKNVAMTRLASLEPHCDTKRNEKKLPPWPSKVPVPEDLLREKDPEGALLSPSAIAYRAIRAVYPDIPSNTAAALSNQAKAIYDARRFDMYIRGTASLPTFRYPSPIPIPKKCVSLRWEDEEKDQYKPVFTASLLGTAKVSMRLSRQGGYHRQKKAIQLWIENPDLLAECAVYRVEKNARPHGGRKAPGGGNGYSSKIMVKLVGFVPKSEAVPKENLMRVSFPEDSFLEAIVEGREKAWRYHNDHLARRLAEHRARLQRLSDDQKFERRKRSRDRQPINDYREILCQKLKRHMDSFVHESTRHLANFARRNHVKTLVLEGEPRCFPSFPSFVWREKLKYKLDDFGIELVEAKTEAAA